MYPWQIVLHVCFWSFASYFSCNIMPCSGFSALYAALEITGGQQLLTARIWYITAQKAFTMIKMTAEFFFVSKIKFSFNLGSVPFN